MNSEITNSGEGEKKGSLSSKVWQPDFYTFIQIQQQAYQSFTYV